MTTQQQIAPIECANTQKPAREKILHPLDNRELVKYIQNLSPAEREAENELSRNTAANCSLKMARMMGEPNGMADSLAYGLLLSDYYAARDIVSIIRSLS